MALIWVLGGTEMQFWKFDRGDLSPGWRWVEIIETWHDINVSHPSRSQLVSMQVSIYASHLHPGHVSPSCRSRKLHLVSIQVQSETHPGIIMCVLLPFMSCLTCIQVPWLSSHLHPCRVSPTFNTMYSHLTSNQVPIFVIHLHPVRLSPKCGILE